MGWQFKLSSDSVTSCSAVSPCPCAGSHDFGRYKLQLYGECWTKLRMWELEAWDRCEPGQRGQSGRVLWGAACQDGVSCGAVVMHSLSTLIYERITWSSIPPKHLCADDLALQADLLGCRHACAA